jgi:hypothetical protein
MGISILVASTVVHTQAILLPNCLTAHQGSQTANAVPDFPTH